jgi:hypothetical protein
VCSLNYINHADGMDGNTSSSKLKTLITSSFTYFDRSKDATPEGWIDRWTQRYIGLIQSGRRVRMPGRSIYSNACEQAKTVNREHRLSGGHGLKAH